MLLTRKFHSAVRLLQSDPRRLSRFLTGRFQSLVVYGTPASRFGPPEQRDGITLRKLTERELLEAAAREPVFATQAMRLQTVGECRAYGLYCHGELAHISWLIEWEQDKRLPLRLVRLRPGEAEITTCRTLPRFRGAGLYPYAIRALCHIAAAQGIQRVLMVTARTNIASRRGIQKAGLDFYGRALHCRFPLFPDANGVVMRFYRYPAIDGVTE